MWEHFRISAERFAQCEHIAQAGDQPRLLGSILIEQHLLSLDDVALAYRLLLEAETRATDATKTDVLPAEASQLTPPSTTSVSPPNS
ncbi:hypothetical protein JYT83_01505, partial [bacterium AH-315-F18]|nr:hypothetical protein [bacterium AH-315-F18]